MSDSKKTIIDIFRFVISNFINLFSGILVGFLLPAIIDVPNYGYYKTFTLYSSYVGFFGLGIIDGIYLKYAGTNFDDLNRMKFRGYSRIVIAIQAFFSLLLLIFSFLFIKGELRYVFCALSVFLIFNNVIGYCQILFQITRRFREISIRNVIQAFLVSMAVIMLFVVKNRTAILVNYQIYLFIYLVIYGILAMSYLVDCKDLIIGKTTFRVKWNTVLTLQKIGIPLLLANLCASLIMSMDRQFVSMLYDSSTYAIYSFSYNVLALVTSATSAIAMVIYPNMALRDEASLTKEYDKFVAIILTGVFAALLSYYPIHWIIGEFLPQYYDSLDILQIVFPGLAISSVVTIVIHNYYKTLGINHIYFRKLVLVLMVTFAINLCTLKLWNTPKSFSFVSILSLLIWYVVSERGLTRMYKIKTKKNLCYLSVMLISFYLSARVEKLRWGFILYSILFLLITILFNRNIIKKLISKVLKE